MLCHLLCCCCRCPKMAETIFSIWMMRLWPSPSLLHQSHRCHCRRTLIEINLVWTRLTRIATMRPTIYSEIYYAMNIETMYHLYRCIPVTFSLVESLLFPVTFYRGYYALISLNHSSLTVFGHFVVVRFLLHFSVIGHC